MTPKEIAAAALAVIVAAIAAAAWRWLRPRYEWCEDCQVWCHDRDDPCECCELELDDDQAAEPNRADMAVRALWRRLLAPVYDPEPIGEYDDGEPVTGELRAVDDAWPDELAELNRARRSGELAELCLDDTARRLPYIALSDDPDLIQWDAKRQAARTWEIAYLEFPALRARLAVEYAAAADDCRDYYGRRMVAA